MNQRFNPDFGEFAAAQTRPLLGFAHALTASTVMVRPNIDRIRRLRRELPLLRGPSEDARVDVVGDLEPWLVEALTTLSPRQRTAMALRYVEDLDIRGIAHRMVWSGA